MLLHTRTLSALTTLAFALLLQAAPQEKRPKDQGEYDIYNQVLKDAADPAKQLADLDRWSQQYPQTDFAQERQWFYVSAYNGTRQPDRVLAVAEPLLDREFPDPKQKLTVLYLTTLNIQGIASPTPAQLAIGKRAGEQLLAFTPTFFTADRKPAGASEAEWAKARGDLDRAANDALDFVALSPGNAVLASKPNDPSTCAQAEPALRQAVEARSGSARTVYALAGALRCQQAQTPDKVKPAMFYYARAAALDPGQGGFTDPKLRLSVEAYLRKSYEKLHGSPEGLDQLKQLALSAIAPPPGFDLKTTAELEAEKDAAFHRDFPQLALWTGIRKQLAAEGGAEFFESQLKGAAVPKLKGTLIDAKPACRPRDLTVGIADPKQPEVVLHLSAPLSGKAELGAEIQWEAVPSAFTATPFLLTMSAEPAAIENLKVTPCAAPRPKK